MSRHLRSAFTLAQSAQAGPSSLRPTLLPRPARSLRPLSTSQARSAWSLPDWFRRPRRADDEDSKDEDESKSIATTEGSQEVTTTGDIFGEIAKEAEEVQRKKARGIYMDHRYKSAVHKISPRKLNLLSRQVSGLPIDEAILQMQFSEKRASKWVKSTLALAKQHAIEYKGLPEEKLIVAKTWVTKGKYGPKQIDIKGRGRFGIKRHPAARFNVILAEGRTREEIRQHRYDKLLNKVRSAGIVREDGKLRRKVVNGWTW